MNIAAVKQRFLSNEPASCAESGGCGFETCLTQQFWSQLNVLPTTFVGVLPVLVFKNITVRREFLRSRVWFFMHGKIPNFGWKYNYVTHCICLFIYFYCVDNQPC